ncbi:MAG: beta-propeller fold lactonase family protein, partial [Cytophagales bacterium]|nr:beta-propeller fold lactonase family protein [Cytophagales bacterium]
MRTTFLHLSLILLSLAACTKRTADQAANPVLAELTARRVTLPNGWSLSPAGRSVPLGDFPMNLAVSASGKYLAVTHNGQSRQSIVLVDAATEKVLSERDIPKAWLGLRFSPDERYLYASGGNDNRVAVYRIEGGQLQEDGEIRLGDPWPKNKISVAGIEVDPRRNVLYAVTKEDSALYTLDLASRKITRRTKLPTEPYTCLLSPVRDELYVSLWGGAKVMVYNTAEGAPAGEIPTESHPNDLVTTRDGKYLFVANANANSVSVIDVAGRKVLETISTALFPEAPAGSTPNAVALSTDEKTLYIANADNNCLAVFDVAQPGKSHPEGFIPTGWYPTAVLTVGNNNEETNGKGFTTKDNPKGPVPG